MWKYKNTDKCFRGKKAINNRQGCVQVLLLGRGIGAVIKIQRLHKNRILRQRYKLWKEKKNSQLQATIIIYQFLYSAKKKKKWGVSKPLHSNNNLNEKQKGQFIRHILCARYFHIISPLIFLTTCKKYYLYFAGKRLKGNKHVSSVQWTLELLHSFSYTRLQRGLTHRS